MKPPTHFLVLSLTLLQVSLSPCTAYKMLLIMTSGTKSHLNFYGGIVDALTRNGHQITMVSPFRANVEDGNVKQIILQEDYFGKLFEKPFEITLYKMMQLFSYTPEQCVKAMSQPEVAEVMKEDYDAIFMPMFFTDCFLGYIYEKKVPLIYIVPNTIASPNSEKLGLPEFPSVTPNVMMPWTYPMSFWRRVATGLLTATTIYGNRLRLDKKVEQISRDMQLWNPEAPSIEELQTIGCLAIINSIRALEVPVKSIPPTIIYAGGIHIKPTKPLHQDLEDWLTGSEEDGFILFSLGTFVKPADMKEEHLQIILTVFRSLKQRIIWKWDSKLIENLPTNVKVISWLPQQDILAHHKIRLFITHGGLLSIQEAIYFSVPVIGMPVFVDQAYNIAKVVADGWGSEMAWNELNEEKFRNVILSTLTNMSFRQTVALKSQLMKDLPTKPADDVTFWVEYVIRHNGAKHLQSPLTHLYWFQIYNVDVWAFIIATSIIIFIILFIFLKSCFRFWFRKCLKRKVD